MKLRHVYVPSPSIFRRLAALNRSGEPAVSVSVMSRHGVLDFEATLDVVQRALKLLLPGVLALFDEMAFGRERDQVRRAPEAIPAA